MLLFAGLAAAAVGAGGADVDRLAKLWPGLHDSTEETVVNGDRGLVAWTEGVEHRVRTVVAPIEVPWLGAHVLYLEEFYQDEPDQLRRQVLLQLEPQGPPEAAVRVHLFSFARPLRWIHLDRRPQLVQKLRDSDVVASAGCDLVLARDGEQFIGGTVGHGCEDKPTPQDEQGGQDERAGKDRYVDYQIVIGQDIYWYHRRVLTRQGDDLQEEVIGYNWFELNEATLFACRIDWSPTGSPRDLRPLQRVELRDEGGEAHFVTPDGRKLDLQMHGLDWPFLGERDALILMVQEEQPPQTTTVGSAWSEIDTQQVSLQLDWLRVRCGPLVPDTDELSGALAAPVSGYPVAAPG
jgi:hypothetical protein